MAVELRCPECRAKLRLAEAPEPGSEIECPKCGHVFPADGNAAGRSEKPAKKAEEPKKKPAARADTGKDGDQPKRKKRRLKKRESNPYVLYGGIAGGLLLLGVFIGAIVWFFNRQSASMQMMTYLPADCDEVSGINLGHLQKYPEFYKSCEGVFANSGFKKAGDAFAKAIGTTLNDGIIYVVQGVGKTGGQTVEATVFKTREKYDTTLLAKLPGAKEYTQDGVKYYTVNDPGLGYPGTRVFGPTDRIVVFCRGDMPDKTFRAMLNGNADDPDSVPYKRAPQLSKQIIRGTAWKFMIYGRSVNKPAPPPPQQGGSASPGGSESDEDQLRKEYTEILAAAQGCGFKASVGSREVRGEFVVWLKDSEAASNMLKKYKEKDWVQDEEKDPPKFFKALASKSGGGKTAQNVIRDGLSFRQSGETFTIRTSMDVNLLKQGVSTLVGSFVNPPQGGGPGGDPGGGGPGGGPPGGPRPGMPRRPGDRPSRPRAARRGRAVTKAAARSGWGRGRGGPGVAKTPPRAPKPTAC